jgi:metal-responsive CopG/Arc/MetJ family transcriptional regulator
MIQAILSRIQINNLPDSQVMVMRTTINVNDRLWNEFEVEIIRRYGKCRFRKKAIEEAIRLWINDKGA